MSDDLNQEIKFTADGSGVKAGVSEIKRDLASIGPAADKAGEAGAAGLNKMGAGGEAAARKLDGATKNMVSSLQRQIAALEAGGTATREYQESIARMRGADLGALKPYLDQLDAAKRKAAEAANANKGLETSFGGIGTAAGLARSAVASALAGLTVGAVVGFVRNINDGVDALNDFKDATGASIENASALEDVALRTGASMDVVTSALVKFNQVLGDAKPGSAQELALKAIGLSAKELRELDPAEALRQTAVALSQYADDGNKARLVQELFGKSVKEVAPFLNDLAEKTALVGKVTAEQTAEAERFSKQLAEMSKNATDLARDLTGPLIASINEVVKKFKEGRAAGKGFFEIGWQNYKDQVSEFWTGKKPETGGATGSWDEPEQPKPSVGDLPDAAAVKARADAARKASEEVRKELGEQAKLMAELSGLTGSFADDWARLTKVFTDKSGVVNVEALAAAQAELLKKQPFMAAAAKAEADARKLLVASYQEQAAIQDELNAAYVADSKAREAGRAAVTDYVRGIQESNDALQFEVSLMGLSEEARKTAIEQYRIELELKKQLEAIDKNTGFDQAQREEERARARAAAAQASINASTRVAIDEGRRMAESIEGSLTDALMRGFESGKGYAENLRDTIKNMFGTLVLRPIISAVVSPVAGAITGALGLSGAANAGTSALGTVGNIASGARLFSGLGAFGGGLSGGFGGLMGSLGLSATGTTLGGALSAGSIALQSGNILGGLGTFAGALGPIALGIGALTSLLGNTKGETRTGGQFGVAFGGEVRNNRRDQTYTYEGQQFDRDFSGGERRALQDGQAYRLEGDPVKDESLIKDAVSGTAKGINSFLESLGSKARVTGFSAGLETSSKDRGGVFSGGTLSNGATFGESGKGDNYAGTLYEKFSTNSPDFKQALQDFSLDLKQSTVQALQSVSDIPESIKRQLEGVDAEALTDQAADALLTSINDQIAGVEQFKGALSAMGLEQFANMAFDTAAAIAEASGGFDALQTNLTGYYQNYTSEAEKTANTTRLVSEALAEVGLQMPATRDEFKAMMEAALAMGDAGSELVAVLLDVQDEFAAITPQVKTLADAFAVSGDTIKGILDDALANAGSAAEASDMASAAFVESIYAGLQDAMTSSLSGLIMGAIQPMVDALIAGATTSGAAMASGGAAGGGAIAAGGAAGGGAVAAGGAAGGGAVAAGGVAAGSAMAAVMDQARAQVAAFAQILADPEIQGYIREIGDMVGGVAGIAYEATTGGAFGGGGGSKWESPGSPSAPGGGAADDYNKALRSIGDTIEDEVKRLRGLMVDDSDVSQEVLLARFGVATAQARAGDKEALALLPELSRAIEQASALTAVSAVDVARMRGWLSGSLEETLKVLKLDDPKPTKPLTPATATSGALNRAPREMLLAAQDEGPIVPRAYNAAAVGGAEDALARELQALRAEVKALRDDANANALSQQRTAVRSMQVLEEWDAGGMPQPRNEGTTV